MRAGLIGIVAAAAALAGCNQGGGDKAETTGETQAAAPAAPALTDAQRQAKLVALPAPYNTADLANGKKQFGTCRSCHTITPDGPNMTGPNLYAVFGRKAGTKPDFAYSDALVAAGWTWDAARLDGWLADPRGYLPGTKMSFAGLDDANDRRDLIAYLEVEAHP